MRVSREERGVTLVEVLVTLLLLSIVLVVAGPALYSSARVVGQSEDDSRGLADIRAVVERMSRDLRAARGVASASTASKLTVWIDYDSDYRESADEQVTWELLPSSVSGQFNVTRTRGGGEPSLAGQTLVSAVAFGYVPGGNAPAAAPDQTRNVRVAINYDAKPGRAASAKRAVFEIRLRNVQ